MMRRLAFALVAAAAVTSSGCSSRQGVIRVVHERPIDGPFVPSEAYGAYLRGAIAEASGDLLGAIEGYSIAVALGPGDAEPWSRLGDVRCARDSQDPKSDDAIEHALAIDHAYAPAWEARARCEMKRGNARAAAASAQRAVEDDPRSVSALATLAAIDHGVSDEVRVRLEAMTLSAGTDATAWHALASWAHGRGDALLEARALEHVAPLEPSRGAELDAAAVRFAGEGNLPLARALSQARVAAAQRGPILPLVARFAVDDALLAGKPLDARRLASKGSLSLTAVAARALLLGDARTARAIAGEVLAADPQSLEASFVLAAAADASGDGRDLGRALSAERTGPSSPVSAEAWLPLVRAVAREGSAEAARALLRGTAHDPLIASDPLTTSVAVSLAEQGALDESDLDANGRIELAERRGKTSPDDVVAAADPRHRLLALARRAPRAPDTLALAQRLAGARANDPIVAVAFARLSLAGAPGAPEMVGVLARLDPTDPLVAGAARDYASRRN